MSKFCDKCREELKNENAKFCDKCGASINQNETKSNDIQSTIICQKCSTVNPTNAKNCINCGAPFNNENFKFLIILGYICGITQIILGNNWFFVSIAGFIISIYLLIKGNLDTLIHAIIIYLLSAVSLFFFTWLGYIPLATHLVIIIIMIIILVILVIYNRKFLN